MTDPRPHCLYRFFDASDALLYIGITCNPGNRWGSHRQTKPWWSQVTKITLETYPDRATVLAAKSAAIASEHPEHNVIGQQETEDGGLDFGRETESQVRSFDHTEIGDMPEYLALQRALDDLAHALDQRQRDGIWLYGKNRSDGRRNWVNIAGDVASVLSFSDSCDGAHEPTDPYWAAIPFRVDRRGESLLCHYYCPIHHLRWTCWYGVAILDLV